jgi:hypothetical protein
MFTSFAAWIVANIMEQTVLIYGSANVLNAKPALKDFALDKTEPGATTN